MRGRLDKFKGVRCRRRIHDFEIEAGGAMQIVKLLERGVSLGACELLGQAAVEGVFEDAVAGRLGLDETLDQPVPCALDV